MQMTLQSVENGVTNLAGGFGTMQTTLETLSSASAANHSETHLMLSQLLQMVAGLSVANQASSRVVEVHDEEEHAANGEPCKELMDIVTRLHARVDSNQLRGKIVSGEAKDIVKDLLLVLKMMSSEFLDVCSTCCGSHVGDLRTSLTTVHAALVPTRQVTVNDTGKSTNRLGLAFYKKLTSRQAERSSTRQAHMARAVGQFPPAGPTKRLYPSFHAPGRGAPSSGRR